MWFSRVYLSFFIGIDIGAVLLAKSEHLSNIEYDVVGLTTSGSRHLFLTLGSQEVITAITSRDIGGYLNQGSVEAANFLSKMFVTYGSWKEDSL